MNSFIEENYQTGLITTQDLQMYLEAGMITQGFYNQLVKPAPDSGQSASPATSSSSFNPVA